MTFMTEAPPRRKGHGANGAGGCRFPKGLKTSCKYSPELDKGQLFCPIGEVSDRLFLAACERQIEDQMERLSIPGFGGTARVQCLEYLAGLLSEYERVAGHAFTMEAA